MIILETRCKVLYMLSQAAECICKTEDKFVITIEFKNHFLRIWHIHRTSESVANSEMKSPNYPKAVSITIHKQARSQQEDSLGLFKSKNMLPRLKIKLKSWEEVCLHVLAAKSSTRTRNPNKIRFGNRFRVSRDFQEIESDNRYYKAKTIEKQKRTKNL